MVSDERKLRRVKFEADRQRKEMEPIPVMRTRWSRSKYWPRADTPKSLRVDWSLL